MKILKNIKVPTGNILIVNGERGKLECLSIGDYGKEKNIKANFMGLTKEINGVPNGDVMPLTKKWVITISSQYGCSINCGFCDVPLVGKGLNATKKDMINQVKTCLELHPEVKNAERVNVHYARMGEPTFNNEVIESAKLLTKYFKKKNYPFHPVVSTMMPKNNKKLFNYILNWILYKNNIQNGNAGLQLSINTTDENTRNIMFSRNANTLEDISIMMEKILKITGLRGRKIALNFALTDSPIEGKLLRKLFDPKYFMVKITPMHRTNMSIDNNYETVNGYEKYYPYKEIEDNLIKYGFDVIVFIPSKEEDESRITCGNAILSQEPQ